MRRALIFFFFCLVFIVEAQAFSVNGTTYTTDGSAADVQNAINAAPAGATVTLPAGAFTWSTPITCSKAIKITGAGTTNTGGNFPGNITTNITDQYTGFTLVDLRPVLSGQLEFCNLNFTAGSAVTSNNNHFIVVDFVNGTTSQVTAMPIAIHDCSFTANNQLLSCILWSQNGGVLWNCTFNTPYDEHIQFKYPGADRWKYPATMGMTPDAATGNTGDPNGTQNTYVEDCHFYNALNTSLDFDDGSRAVMRNSTFTLCASGSHGYDTSPWGGRHWEIYNNNFVGDNGVSDIANAWLTMRTGTGDIAGNTFENISAANWGNNPSVAWLTDGACQAKAGHCFTTIPIPRAPGQGWNGSSPIAYSYPQAPELGYGYIKDPIYVWGNINNNNAGGLWSWNMNRDCPSGLASNAFIIQNTDFFIGVAKPNWTPYTYPHPVHAALSGLPTPTGGSATPAAPTNLRIVQ